VVTSFGAPPVAESARSGRPAQYVRSRPRGDRWPRHKGRAPAAAGRADRTRPDGGDRGRHRAAHGAAHRAAARSYIEEHLTDPNLGAAEIAAAAGISERQPSRLFASDGTSVPRRILARRLHLARSVLSAPREPTVAEVAVGCGFT
jgi:AraC-like DNA-binding protein